MRGREIDAAAARTGVVMAAPVSGAGRTTRAGIRAGRRLASGVHLATLLVALVAAMAGATPPSGVPARIISLAPSVTETLFALGAGPRVIAVSDFCDYPPEVAGLPRIGTFLTPSIETIVGLRPDVVIGTPSPGNHQPIAALRRLGVRVEIADPERLEDLPLVTRVIAAAAGEPAAGDRLVAEIERDMARVRARVAGAPPERVLMVVGQEPLIAVGRSSYLGELLEAAGGRNVAPPSGAWPHLSIEYVIAADPEVIIDSSMGTEEGTATLAFWARLSSLAAVRAGRVHGFRSYHALRPGPRLPAAFADIARLVHPERW